MAQWLGQYTGNTHKTKVQDIEKSLRKAVDAFKVAAVYDKERKTKALLHLAKRLLRARHKMMRARIALLTEGRPPSETSQKVAHLIAQEQELIKFGVSGILKEFGGIDLGEIESENE